MAKKIKSEDLIRGWESQLPAKPPAPAPKAQKYTRKTYLLTDEMIAEIEAIATTNQVPVNELVRFIFQQSIDGLKNGSIKLPIQARTVYTLE